ncbi:MAG: acetoacetate--CoA ligase [Syntrophaceae bacterium]|nr:acetoacetate--CoA ligase [Syntrophaceae bacterium]
MNDGAIKEGDLLWHPSDQFKKQSNLADYMQWLEKKTGFVFQEYADLWEWSVANLEDFWESLWAYFKITASKPYAEILSERKMPGATWFKGAELNFTEHVFRNRSSNGPALIFQSEIQSLTKITWAELEKKVASVAAAMRRMGIQKGDRVVAYMPNIPETAIAFLASASIGAVWSSCSPDFGTRSVIDRFRQIGPKVLFTVDGYQYGGKRFECCSAAEEIRKGLPTLNHTVMVNYLERNAFPADIVMWETLLKESAELAFSQVPFDHPLWIVYSSGTTGLPKALVHSQGGILIEMMKFLSFHLDLHPTDRFFWFCTTGWIMWNILIGGLLVGATPVLFDGNPGYPDLDLLWNLAEKSRATFFGTGAPYLTACMQAGLDPGSKYDLSKLKGIGSTGSPLPPEGFQWVYDKVKKDVWLGSVSGGTDIASGFFASCPLLPVHAGEIQCRCLGVKAEALDEEGNSLVNEVGELVVTEPIPSMPLYLWDDPDGQRYFKSYFEMYPGLWRHGDWVKVKPRGSAVIVGRSDSTLKRMGVRMGSGDFYSAVEALPEVVDSLIVGFDTAGGSYFMPLFVVTQDGMDLDVDLKVKIREKIRTALSPRHLPDEIYAIDEVPRTLNGKKLEVPVKKILMGFSLGESVNPDSMSNPKSMAYFLGLSKTLNAA